MSSVCDPHIHSRFPRKSKVLSSRDTVLIGNGSEQPNYEFVYICIYIYIYTHIYIYT